MGNRVEWKLKIMAYYVLSSTNSWVQKIIIIGYLALICNVQTIVEVICNNYHCPIYKYI